MSDPGSTYRTRDEISGVRQVIHGFCWNIKFDGRFLTLNNVSFFWSGFQERDPIERIRKTNTGPRSSMIKGTTACLASSYA